MYFHKIKFILRALLVQSKFLILAILFLPALFFYKMLSFRESLWLIGENEGRCLSDNGYTFFIYCRKYHLHSLTYFIASKESIRTDNFLKNEPNVIVFGSLKHVFFFLLSDTLIYSHAQSDVGYIQIIKLLKRNCKRVFLQHGIIAFKKIHSTYRKNHNEMDIFTVSSDFEKKIILDNFSFNEETVKVTGLARYDMLSSVSSSYKKTILYMPTWRNWAFPLKNAKTYISGINAILNDTLLSCLLEKHSVQFKFAIHDKMECYLDFIETSDMIITIYSPEKSIQNLIKESSLLITDYSSVAWDFYYLGKPVLFYQFDQKEYLFRKGSYIDFNRELFGEVFMDCDSLVTGIEKYFINNFQERPEYAKKRDLYFNFKDTNNCERIFDTIISL